MPVQTRSAFHPNRIALALSLALMSGPALSVDYFWDPTGSLPATWTNQSRWQLSGGAPAPTLPNSATRVLVRRDNSFVGIGGNYAASSADIIVGGLAGQSAQMNINSPALLSTSGDGFVGRRGEGRVEIGSATWTLSGALWIGGYTDDVGGDSRDGSVLLRGETGLISATNLYIGASHNATGSLTLDTFSGAPGGTVNIDQAVVVGARRDLSPTPAGGGTGSISMTAAARLNSASGILGEHVGSSGSVSLSAVNTRWSLTGPLQVGKAGQGDLAILASARVGAGNTVIGAEAGSTGSVSVLGNGRLQNSTGLVVGEFGEGVLELAGGGSVGVGGALNNGQIQLAAAAGSTGILRQGNGAVPGLLDVALVFGGIGGKIEFNHTQADYDLANSFGVPVAIGGALSVEHLGSGKTRVFTDSIYGGSTLIRGGTLEIDGVRMAGPSSNLIIGSVAGDNGELILRSGAQALSPFGFLTMADGAASSIGRLELSGSDTRLETGVSRLGRFGTADVQVTSGATVQNTLTLIADLPSSVGTLSLGGVGTRWDVNTGSMTIGVQGEGTVNLRGGATLRIDAAPRTVTLANQSGATGTLNIGTGGTTGTLDVANVFGGGGTAVLNFNHSDADYHFVSVPGVPIKILGSTRINHLGPGRTRIQAQHLDNPAGGRITLRAGALQLDNLARLFHGNAELVAGDLAGDQAELDIIEGSMLKSLNGRLGRVAGSSGTVRVSDPGSEWELTGNLIVGGNGSGSLSVRSGAGVRAQTVTLGRVPGASGSVVVNEQGSNLRSSADVVVGREGSGSMIVRGGGRLSAGGEVGGGSVILGELSGSSGSLSIGNGAQPGVLNASAVVGGAGSATLSFNHDATDYLFQNDAGFPVSILGSTRVLHGGPGSTRIDGVMSYTGDTQVSAGMLILNGQVASTAVLVTDVGTLAGNAVLTGAGLNVDEGGTLMPGDGIGTFQTTALAIDPDAFLVFELSTPGIAGGELNDHIVVEGDLALAGELHVIGLPGFGSGRYPLLSYGGSLTGSALMIGSLPPGLDPGKVSLDFSVPGEVALVVDGFSSDLIFLNGFEQP